VTALEHFLGQPRVEAEPGIIGQHLGHLSASSIGMLLRCPRQFQRRYLFGEKERPGEGMVVGDFFHETMEWNYGQKILSGTDYPLSDAIQYLHDEAIPRVLEENGGEEEIEWTTTAEIAKHDADRITSAYYQAVVPRIQPVSVEEKFSIDFDGLEVPVIGYIDTEDADRILDTKTGKQATRKLKPSWNLQGRLYTYARKKPTEFHSISRAQVPTIVTALESDQMTVQLLSETQFKEMQYLVGTAAELLRHFLTHLGTEQDWPTWGSVPDWTRNMLPCDRCGWRQGCPAWM
jgi:hypothetical protein